MLIKAGYSIAFDCPQPTPMLLLLKVHPDRVKDLRSEDRIHSDPALAQSSYLDCFGNVVTRLSLPPGRTTVSNDFTIEDCGRPDRPAPRGMETPVDALPDDAMVFLIASRYCDSDRLSNFAWANFGHIKGAAERVEAICTYVHQHIRFDYQLASPFRTASDGLNEAVGVCRDFAHLAIALCRATNIPARYCTGYLGDIGVPLDPNPMDFSAWFEAFIGGDWYTFDARHNKPRIGRIVMARGRDAADVALSTSFGLHTLARFDVHTYQVEPIALEAC